MIELAVIVMSVAMLASSRRIIRPVPVSKEGMVCGEEQASLQTVIQTLSQTAAAVFVPAAPTGIPVRAVSKTAAIRRPARPEKQAAFHDLRSATLGRIRPLL